MASEYGIRLGDKVDMRSVDSINRAEKSGEKVPVLATQVIDIINDKSVIIAMPYEMGRMILLDLRESYELVFYTDMGLYRTIAVVSSRRKEDNIFSATMTFQTSLAKYQRREYFRLQCIIGAQYYTINEDMCKKRTENEIFALVENNDELRMTEQSAVVVDLSGGGVRFIGTQKLEKDDLLAIKIPIMNETINEIYMLPGRVITCNEAQNAPGRYEARFEFIIHTAKIRDTIIKYIFEEDRKLRQRGR